MRIELSSENAALAQELIDRGEFESLDDLLHSALLILHRETIHSHIGDSLQQAAQGQAVSLAEAKSRWAEERRQWLAAHPSV
jgi:Arc/MetJ-type ribon-helix-helix transcriptional regulator